GIGGGVDVDVGVLGQPGRALDLLDRRRGTRADPGVLEDDGVAEQQVGGREAGHLVVGVVPRHHADERADRLGGDAVDARPGHIEQLGLDDPGAVLAVPAIDRRGELDLTTAWSGSLPISVVMALASSSASASNASAIAIRMRARSETSVPLHVRYPRVTVSRTPSTSVVWSYSRSVCPVDGSCVTRSEEHTSE